jgi:hypothetical protein
MVEFHSERSMSVVQGGGDFCNVRLPRMQRFCARSRANAIFLLSQFLTKKGAKFFFVAIFSLKERKLWFSFPNLMNILSRTSRNVLFSVNPCSTTVLIYPPSTRRGFIASTLIFTSTITDT